MIRTFGKIAARLITCAEMTVAGCSFAGRAGLSCGRFVAPFAAVGNEFGAPHGNICRTLVLQPDPHAATFAFDHAGFGLRLVLKTADTAGLSCVMMGIGQNLLSLDSPGARRLVVSLGERVRAKFGARSVPLLKHRRTKA